MATISHYVTAVNKDTKDKVKIGVMFDSEYGYSLLLGAGTVIKVTKAWDKDAKAEVDLDEPVYIKAETHFINCNTPMDKGDDKVRKVTAQAKKVFGVPF